MRDSRLPPRRGKMSSAGWRLLATALLWLLATGAGPCSASLTHGQPHANHAPISAVNSLDGEPTVVDGHGAAHDGHNASGHQHHSYHVASLNFESVQTPFAIALWVFIASIAKIGFHMANKLSSIFPESVLLIVLGVVIGLLLFYTHLMRVPILTPTTFFMFMLPPIVLDAGYFMPNRLFFDNLGTILLFAVIGTVFNTLTIGVSLWAVGLTGLYGVDLGVLDAFLFSALICAVDPVAVLAVFEEIHVNEVLYIVVFGESLLNDAVTVVLYHMFEAYTEMGESNIMYSDVLLGFASFFVVAIGGTAIGIVWGFLTGFVTRFTNHVRVIEPLLVFVMAYLSHLTAEMFHLSGILAITFCGICAKNYVETNVSLKSHTTIKYAMKMLSSVSETIIFLFLGVSAVNDYHDWNTWFVIFTILFCTLYRAIGVVILTSLANHFRLHKLNKVEEFVMAYGGLRGAVAFALALTIDVKVVKHKLMFVTATIAMVYFTVLFQGVTIKPLVNLLRVKKSSKRKVTMNERIHERFMDHLMAGIEDILGHSGNYHLRDKFKYYDNTYIRKWLVRDHHAAEPKILETFSKLNLRDAKEFLVQNGSFAPSNNLGIGTDMSLATLFRNYTQTNLDGESQYSLNTNDANICNLDMQELDYSPSAKDLNDARLHHILNDAMFKVSRRHRKYSRNVIHEQDPHPPFRHMVRMQIRHMLSEEYKNPKKTGKRKNVIGNGYLYTKNNHLSPVINGSPYDNTSNTRIYVTDDKDDSEFNYYVNPALEDEDGITFTARPSDGLSTSSPTPTVPILPLSQSLDKGFFQTTDGERGASFGRRPPSPPPPQTVTESQLPWRRGEQTAMVGTGTSADPRDDRPVVQQEFPSWVENRDYNAYTSPTTTFLNRLETPRETPPVYQIFEESSEELHEASGQSRANAGRPSQASDNINTTQL